MKPGILVISGPSGAGKSRLSKDVLKARLMKFSVSATSRTIRPGEVDGIDYHFITQAAFEQKIAEGAFIEYEEVHTKSYYYGTLKAPIAEALKDGGSGMLFEVDVRGHANLKKLLKEQFPDNPFLGVFIMPPSRETLVERLTNRPGSTPEDIARRMKTVDAEIARKDEFDYILVNDVYDTAFAELLSVIDKRLGSLK